MLLQTLTAKVLAIIFEHYFISFICVFALARWLITYKNHKTGDGFSREVETYQTRDELMKRSAGALSQKSDLPTSTKRVRGGFWLWNDDATMNGKIKK